MPVADVLYLKAEQICARSREREYLLDESLVQLGKSFPTCSCAFTAIALIARDAVKGVAQLPPAWTAKPIGSLFWTDWPNSC